MSVVPGENHHYSSHWNSPELSSYVSPKPCSLASTAGSDFKSLEASAQSVGTSFLGRLGLHSFVHVCFRNPAVES